MVEQFGDDGARVEAAQVRRAEHRGEHLLDDGAARLPPPASLRVTTVGRRAYSARQFVASNVESNRNEKMAGNSTLRCAVNRSTSATILDH
jgi:hypothetical protein